MSFAILMAQRIDDYRRFTAFNLVLAHGDSCRKGKVMSAQPTQNCIAAALWFVIVLATALLSGLSKVFHTA